MAAKKKTDPQSTVNSLAADLAGIQAPPATSDGAPLTPEQQAAWDALTPEQQAAIIAANVEEAGAEPEPVGPPPPYAGHVPHMGDRVLFILDQGPHAGEARPADVVFVVDDYDAVLDLQVLTRGQADNLRDVVFRAAVRPGRSNGQWVERN